MERSERFWHRFKGEEGESEHGYSGQGYSNFKKAASLRKLRLGGPSCRCRFSAEMYRVRTSDYDSAGKTGKKSQADQETGIIFGNFRKSLAEQQKTCYDNNSWYMKISLLFPVRERAKRPKGGKIA